MLCYQCEQTSKGTGCSVVGVCGKDAETAALQDLLVEMAKGISMYAHRAGEMGKHDNDVDQFVLDALFTTVTNVNFDPERIAFLIQNAVDVRSKAQHMYEAACGEKGIAPEALTGPNQIVPSEGMTELVHQGQAVGLEVRMKQEGPDITGLKELIVYGLKGAAAYMDHARILGVTDQEVVAFFHEAMDALTQTLSAEVLTGLALKVGEKNLKVMELLDAANTTAYGHPEPTRVRVTPIKGKCLLVSGHDLKDLEEILKQTEGKGINVYTHGEMLPTLAYPGLKKFKHLVGNYGGAWQDQQKEFNAFPGSIVMTTNCIQKPKEDYKGRIFTTNLVAWPGVTHIKNYDFSPAVEAALESEGFTEDAPEGYITIGFGHNAVMNVAPTVIDAVKSGDIRHFFLVGGCDGAKSGRNYYTDFAKAVPEDCVILTLACGKFRFNKLEFGDIGGIPRLLDVGQCNDAYSAIRIAAALADAFGTDVNGLPLSFILSWYEQKAVTILLSLLHLGIKDIRIGPTLPAFITPPVLQVLVENFNIMPVSTVEKDMAACLSA